MDRNSLLKQINQAETATGDKRDLTDPRERAKVKAEEAMKEGNYFKAFEIYTELGLQHQKEEALRKMTLEKQELSEFKMNKVVFYGRENCDQGLLEEFKKAYGLE